MKFSLSQQDAVVFDVDLLVLAAFEGEELQGPDEASTALLQRVAKEEGFEGKRDQKLSATLGGRPGRIIALGLGAKGSARGPQWRNFAGEATKAAQKVSAKRLALVGPEAKDLAHISEGVLLGAYQYDRYKAEPAKRPLVEVVIKAAPSPSAEQALVAGENSATSVIFARDIANEPANFLTPTELANRAAQMAKEEGLECKVLGPKECAELKMGLLLAVAQGSREEARFVHLTYKPKGSPAAKIALVGKGVTFDSGGLSLKPPKSMIGMQYDMSGSAAVFGAMRAIARLQPNVEVHGIAPLVENMPSGTAYRPSDVFRAMSGKTVEVLNTDAEGRLILADALWYAAQLKPDTIVDLATLTGACLVALGNNIAGAFGSDKPSLDRLLGAAETVGEEFWPLPLSEKMRADLKGEVGDLRNVTGDPAGGAIVGALFLQEFTDGRPWIHLDIAGPAHAEKETPITAKGGTGFGVLTVVEFVRRAGE
jgi:leucyl aminopeptidase